MGRELWSARAQAMPTAGPTVLSFFLRPAVDIPYHVLRLDYRSNRRRFSCDMSVGTGLLGEDMGSKVWCGGGVRRL